MGELIDDFLIFSRLGRRAFSVQRVPMQPMVAELVQGLRREAPERQLQIEIGELPDAKGDPLLIRQVWSNLLYNAAKFTAKSPHPRIAISGLHDPVSGASNYVVEDNGVGFDPTYTDKLFGAFQRLHRTEDFPGTGLGLAIVKRIVERHGGTVSASGEPGQGARFSFTLPGDKP